MKKKLNSLKFFVCAIAILLCLPASSAGAMHIMEGYLPVGWCARYTSCSYGIPEATSLPPEEQAPARQP